MHQAAMLEQQHTCSTVSAERLIASCGQAPLFAQRLSCGHSGYVYAFDGGAQVISIWPDTCHKQHITGHMSQGMYANQCLRL